MFGLLCSIFRGIAVLGQFIPALLDRYNAMQAEKRYEEVRSNPSDVWSNGFGVRSEQANDPDSSTSSSQ